MNKVYNDVMSGKSDSNIRFNDLRNLLESLGFKEKIKGDHHIFKKDGIPDRINIQPVGSKSKAYQVKQIRLIIEKYSL